MSENPEDRITEERNSNEPATSRRDFVTGAAAGLFVGLSGAAATPAQAQTAPTKYRSAMTADPAAPKSLGPKGIPDLRFPLSFQEPVAMGTRVLIDYFAALSQRDLKGMADTMHFPFGSYEGAEAVVVNSADDLIKQAPASMNMSMNPERYTDHDGYMKPGCYDVFVHLEVLNSDPVRTNMALTYDRYDKYGKRLLRCEGVYGASNNDGRWGLQVASTIFTPSDLVGTKYEDTVEAAKRLRINHDLAYQVSDLDGVWGRVRQYGRTLGVGGPRGNGVPWQVAPDGNAEVMKQYRFVGVKNRLGNGVSTPESIAKIPIDFKDTRDRVARAGVGYWGFPVGILPDTRVLHATVDKAHMYSGVTRYNVTGEEISNSVEVSIITYKNGRWGWAGSLAYITNHDRANDIVP